MLAEICPWIIPTSFFRYGFSEPQKTDLKTAAYFRESLLKL
jgi:hypothetical protein